MSTEAEQTNHREHLKQRITEHHVLGFSSILRPAPKKRHSVDFMDIFNVYHEQKRGGGTGDEDRDIISVSCEQF